MLGLPTLGNARDDIAGLIEISEAGVQHGRRMGGVELIITVRIEAGRINAWAKLQHTTALRMALGCLTLQIRPSPGSYRLAWRWR